MKQYFFAIDVGGTSTKGGIVDENNTLLARAAVKTVSSNNSISNCIFELIKKLEDEANLKIENATGLGIGIPGEIDCQKGVVCVSRNLGLENYNIIKELKNEIDIPIKIANDANLAALGEYKLGAAKSFKNFVVLTLGTGIGGDFYVDGKPFSSISQFSGEFGHIKVVGGENKKCACGEYDCFELYGSTRALTNQTREAMLANKNSKMWQTYTDQTVNGKTVFEYLKTDDTAKLVFEKFITHLGTGIVSLVNLLMPQAIIIAGSISNQKKNLTEPLEKYVNNHIYAKDVEGCYVKIVPAQLGANAAIFGAKYLFE